MADRRLERIDIGSRKATIMNTVYRIISFCYGFSLYSLLKKKLDPEDKSLLPEEIYNLVWLAVLAGWLLFGSLVVSHAGWAVWIGVALAGARLIGLLMVHAEIVFLESDCAEDDAKNDGVITVRHAQRWLLFVLLDFVEVAMCYAILYLSIESLCAAVPPPFTLHLATPASITAVLDSIAAGANAFYFSIATIVTLGYGDFAPLTPLARAVVSSEVLYGLFFLVVIFIVVMPSIRTTVTSDKKFK